MPDPSLDSPEIYERLDPSGLASRILGLPDQIAEAWTAARALELPPSYREARNIVVLGMGGSGIGGALMERLLIEGGAPARLRTVRGYRLPADIGKHALVFASSNSGDTEETVAAFADALERGCMCIAITAGGRIASMARDAGVPLLAVNWHAEPRAALGWSFAAPLAICGKLGLIPDADESLAGALDEMREVAAQCHPDSSEQKNTAKQLARRVAGRLPLFVGAESFAPVAYRWRTQTNENGKSWAIADELPEMNHNAPVGYGLPQRIVPLLHAVLLRHASVHPRVALRFDATRDQMQRAGVSAEIVDVTGSTLLAQVLRGVMLGDMMSYYLGLLNVVDPSPVDALVELKEFLASSG
jgi:glucose/mannose-6-phosphate isomerase